MAMPGNPKDVSPHEPVKASDALFMRSGKGSWSPQTSCGNLLAEKLYEANYVIKSEYPTPPIHGMSPLEGDEQGGSPHTAVSLADESDPPAEEDEGEEVPVHAIRGGRCGPQGGVGQQGGPFSYSEEETLCLGRVWVDTAVNARTGNNPRGEAMWTRIAKRYNAIRPQGSVFRSSEKLRNHWKRASADIKVFESCYLSCKRDLGSDVSHDQIIIDAFAEFQKLKAKPFKHYTTWEKVRGTPKFLAATAIEDAVKRCKTNIDGSYTTAESSRKSAPSTEIAGSAISFGSESASARLAKLAHSIEFSSMYEVYTKDTSGMTPEVLKRHLEMVEFIRKKLGMQPPSEPED